LKEGTQTNHKGERHNARRERHEQRRGQKRARSCSRATNHTQKSQQCTHPARICSHQPTVMNGCCMTPSESRRSCWLMEISFRIRFSRSSTEAITRGRQKKEHAAAPEAGRKGACQHRSQG